MRGSLPASPSVPTEQVEKPVVGDAAWQKFANDFANMTDDQIADETRRSQDQLDEAEEWLEAVAAWEVAGRPRKGGA